MGASLCGPELAQRIGVTGVGRFSRATLTMCRLFWDLRRHNWRAILMCVHDPPRQVLALRSSTLLG